MLPHRTCLHQERLAPPDPGDKPLSVPDYLEKEDRRSRRAGLQSPHREDAGEKRRRGWPEVPVPALFGYSDIKFIYNLAMTCQPRFYNDQRGILGRLLGGWDVAPIFTAQTGSPLRVNTSSGNSGAFGEIFSSSGSADCEGAALAAPFTGGNSAHYKVTVPSGAGINGNPDRGGSGINIFADPNAIFAEFRRLVLGIDHNGGGWGMIRGFPTWNLDATLSKEIRATERIGATLMFQFTNLLNHFQPSSQR